MASIAEPTAESKPKRRRFNKTVPADCEAGIQPPHLTLEQGIMGQLLPCELLDSLAQRVKAGDVRKRKLTCTLFFWLVILAVGPGGPISLHKILSYLVAAMVMAGLGAQRIPLSKEALSENFRERSWQFFEGVLEYLLSTYMVLWNGFVGQPGLVTVRRLRVMLMDATLMRVARQLIKVFPGSANGKCQEWAAVRLHMAYYVFQQLPQVVALSEQKRDERHIDFLRPVGEASGRSDREELAPWAFGRPAAQVRVMPTGLALLRATGLTRQAWAPEARNYKGGASFAPTWRQAT